MQLTPQQEQIGKDNFNEAVASTVQENPTRRDVLKGGIAAATGLGSAYFGYQALEGDRVKVGFIGTGDEGNILITQHPKDYMEIVAIADLRPSNLKRAMKGDGNQHRVGLVNRLGEETAGKIQQFPDHKAMLDKAEELGLEAVVIAVPLNAHAPVAMDCLDAGLHVLSEKLMAHNVTECKQLIRKAREKNLLYAVGHQRHYSVLYENANNLVQQGLLGEIKYIRAQWHRNNSFPGRDSWVKKASREDLSRLNELEKAGKLKEFGYENVDKLVNWRLYNDTGGGLMAELGSHQLDAASIFLGKVHPVAVQGYGGKNFYGVDGVGSKDKQTDKREIFDHIYVTFEFPGPNYEKDKDDICIVTYSSISTNRFEPYGELVYGSRGTLIMKTEKEAMLYKEEGGGSKGGIEQRLHVINADDGSAPVLDAYETTAASSAAVEVGAATAEVSRGYTEEMEHFCHCVRTENFAGPKEGGLRCDGVVAMADAIMALTANKAMATRQRIEFKPEWFDPDSDEVPDAVTKEVETV